MDAQSRQRVGRAAQDRHRREYERRVNRVLDHIRTHLAEDLTLERLAGIAAFSPFHFHRVFVAVTGETLSDFIRRLRIERAASALKAPHVSVIAVALNYGFSSAATFARAFKAHFGMSASEWRSGGAERWGAAMRAKRNEGKTDRKPSKVGRAEARHDASMSRAGAIAVTVKELPSYRVAYMRNVGPYGPHGIPGLWMRLRRWMAVHELESEDVITLGVAHDDPSVVAPEKLRYDACVVVPESFVDDRSIDLGSIAGGKYAVAAFIGTTHEIEDAWDKLFGEWLPASGYQPADRPCFERHRGDPRVPGDPERFRCELCLPVVPLRL